MEKKDCFFFIDGESVPEEERRMRCVCAKCVMDKKIDGGWFWEGSKRGYGKYVYKCESCGEIIYKPGKND